MKLVVAVVQPQDADSCVSSLVGAGYTCTRLRSEGGFLEGENVTLLIAAGDEQVDAVIGILTMKGKRRAQSSRSMDVEVGAAVLVLAVERLEKL